MNVWLVGDPSGIPLVWNAIHNLAILSTVKREYFKRIPLTMTFVNPNNKIIIFINPVLSSSAKIDIYIITISICILISLFQIWRTVSKRTMTRRSLAGAANLNCISFPVCNF